jgi:hypothetical protein
MEMDNGFSQLRPDVGTAKLRSFPLCEWIGFQTAPASAMHLPF